MRRTTEVGILVLCTAVLTACGRLASTPTNTPGPAAPLIELVPESPSLDDTWTRPGGALMVYVPAGEFEMGSADEVLDYALRLCNEHHGRCEREWFEDAQPMHVVALDGFWIDRTEVTNAQYAECVETGACDPPTESDSFTRDTYYGNSVYDDYPVIWVTWDQAAAYCTWAGARLPTEAEWEYTARGPEGYVFPWGGEFDGTRPVGSYPDGASWCGAWDLAGNVWEWVADRYGEYSSRRQENPVGPSSGVLRALRGGSWYFAPWYALCTLRGRLIPDYADGNLGFRCAFPVSGSDS
jgi:formylglycine-generating enzyme required for sulfatase activity